MPKFQVPPEAAAFLLALAEGQSVAAAAHAAGVARCTPYRWRADRAFAEAWADAIEAGTDRLEDEALRRLVDKSTARGGSDTLLMALLAARRPEKFRASHRADQPGRKDDTSEGARATLERKLARLAQRQASPGLPEETE
jgi:hypothetical protein